MRKEILTLIMAVFLASAAMAAVGIKDDGAMIGPATDINVVGTAGDAFDGVTYVVDLRKLTAPIGVGTTSAVSALQVGAGTPGSVAIGTTNDMYVAGDVEVDGRLYLAGITDPSIYGGAAGVGAGKAVFISADGRIYAP